VISTETALYLTRALFLLAVLLQSLENFALARLPLAQSAWQWSLIRSDTAGLPSWLQRFFDRVFSRSGFFYLTLAQGLLAAMALAGRGEAFVYPALFLSLYLSAIRFRGTICGGSDSMTLVLSSALAVHAFFRESPDAERWALAYIAAQSTLSYLVSAVVKLRSGAWRSGRAVEDHLAHSDYDVPAPLRRALGSSGVRMALAWLTMIFEASVALLYLKPAAAPYWLALGVAFHLANFAVLGLNRFVFVWIATYPALLWALSQF
jgi:hypothetical protein